MHALGEMIGEGDRRLRDRLHAEFRESGERRFSVGDHDRQVAESRVRVDELVVTLPWGGAGDVHEFELGRGIALAEHEHADGERLGVGEAGVGGERGLDRETREFAEADPVGVEADRLIEVGDDAAEVDGGAREGGGLSGNRGKGGAEQGGEGEAVHAADSRGECRMRMIAAGAGGVVRRVKRHGTAGGDMLFAGGMCEYASQTVQSGRGEAHMSPAHARAPDRLPPLSGCSRSTGFQPVPLAGATG